VLDREGEVKVIKKKRYRGRDSHKYYSAGLWWGTRSKEEEMSTNKEE